MAGINPMTFLDERDPFARSVMLAIAERRVAIAEDERDDLAERIIHKLGKAMTKK